MRVHRYQRDGIWYDVPRPERLATVVRNALLNALAFTNGAKHPAAKLLGISPRTLVYQMKTHSIPPLDERTDRS